MSNELTMPELRKKHPDIWEAASSIATAPRVEGALFSENYVMPLARAILAERSRKLNLAAAATEFCRALEDDGADFHVEVGPQGGWLLDSTEVLPLTKALERALAAASNPTP